MDDKLETVFEIANDSFYDVDIYSPSEYQDIISEPDEGIRDAKKYIYSIIKKCEFEKDTAEDLENYYFICNKCDATIYYNQRETHILYHLEQEPCCCCIL